MAAIWPRGQLLRALVFGVLSGLAGALLVLSPWGWQAEERFGLDWLFQLRGPIAAPADVVIVAIDKAASDELGVPYDTTRWPRDLHARLLNGLHSAGASVVIFDLLFRQPRETEDDVFAGAMVSAGNVALLEFLEKDQPGMVEQADRLMPVTLQQRVLPAPKLAAAMAGSGPFTLPKVPERVSQFWTFDHNAGDTVSLPLVALLLHAAPEYRNVLDRIAAAAPLAAAQLPSSLVALVADRRPVDAAVALSTLIRQADTATKSGDRSRSRYAALAAVLGVLRSPISRYFNFYGPPRTIATVSYADALRGFPSNEDTDIFTGKAVFVGVSSPVQWQLQDEFHTVYSDADSGLDLSGIEILATGFANLRDGTDIRPLASDHVVGTLLVWGTVIGLLAWLLRPLPALIVAGLMCALYLYLAVSVFGSHNTWVPVFFPLLIQAPLMLFAATMWQHRMARGDLNRIRETFGHYLPQTTVDRLVKEGFHPLEDRRTVFGVCLMTDAQGYTAIAEKLPSEQLVDLVNDYLEVVIGPIRLHGGEISDIKGDSVLALWVSRQDDLAIRSAACRALSEIQQAVAQWNDANTHGVHLPTRIGLHCGSMTLASVGAADHYEQRAVGDIVNTASRLEQLSKELGTRLLVSAETVRDVEGVVTRYLGRFVLKGRTAALEVHELLGWGEDLQTGIADWLRDFAVGVEAFERQEWGAAETAFNTVLGSHDGDTVARWYLERIRTGAQSRR